MNTQDRFFQTIRYAGIKINAMCD